MTNIYLSECLYSDWSIYPSHYHMKKPSLVHAHDSHYACTWLKIGWKITLQIISIKNTHSINRWFIVSTAPYPTKHIRELVSRPSVSPSCLLFVTCSLKTPNTQRLILSYSKFYSNLWVSVWRRLKEELKYPSNRELVWLFQTSKSTCHKLDPSKKYFAKERNSTPTKVLFPKKQLTHLPPSTPSKNLFKDKPYSYWTSP